MFACAHLSSALFTHDPANRPAQGALLAAFAARNKAGGETGDGIYLLPGRAGKSEEE